MSFAAEERGGAAPGKTTILVVEHASSGSSPASILEAADREIVRVPPGPDVLRVLSEHDVAVCLLPADPIGIATAVTIAGDERTRSVPIILLAGSELDPASIERAYASGVADVIPRSLDAAILRAKISVFTRLHQRRIQEVAGRAAHHAGQQALMLATLGEELRPPLNAIVGWVRMLKDGSMRDPQRARALETVERTAQAQLDLIADMLDVSRMTSKTLTLDLVAVDLRRIVEAVVEAHRPAAVEKQLTLFAALDDDLAPMFADPERLRQIVHRLMSNAVVSTPTEGVVTVSLRNVDSTVELAITDTSASDGAKIAPRVFDGFAILRHLVELHDGTIEIEAPGPGRRFVVHLPAAGRPPRTDDEAR